MVNVDNDISLGNIAPGIEQASRGEWKVKVSGENADKLAELFEINLDKKVEQNRTKMWADSDFAYYPIDTITESEYSGFIYDLEVEEEHSYLTHVGGHNSLGEGWGLVAVEHSCTGAVQVVPNHSACKELWQDCGILIPAKTEYLLDDIMTTGYLVDPYDVAGCLEFLYQNREIMSELAERGKNKFSAKEYTWPYISGLWNDLFHSVL
jgi:glycosyltransferase involved in cell wall biosynthesis